MRTLHRCGATPCDDPACGHDDELATLLRSAVAARAGGPLLQREKTKHPDQTCEDDDYIPLRKEVEVCKLLPTSCSDDTERKDLGVTTRKAFSKMPASEKWSVEALEGRLANARRYLAARETFQETCFAGTTDKGHDTAMTQLRNAVKTCEAKAAQRAEDLL